MGVSDISIRDFKFRSDSRLGSPYFESVSVIVFIVSVGDYFVSDPNEPGRNRLAIALDLFEDIVRITLPDSDKRKILKPTP